MASRIIACTKAADGYRVTVHLDTSETVAALEAKRLGLLEGDVHPDDRGAEAPRTVAEVASGRLQLPPDAPHPDALHEWTWGLPQPSALPLHENGGHEESGAFLHAAHTQHGQDLTEQQYLENIFAMLPGMIELELHRRRATSHHDRNREPVPALHGREIN